jgi:hypothetical protein
LIRWLVRSAMVSVAAENMGGAVFHPMDKTKGNATSWGSPGFGGESNTKLGDVFDFEIDAIKAIADVEFQELDGTKGGVGQDELTQDCIKGMSKLHGLERGEGQQVFVHL